MPDRARAVIVGGGIVGCAAAYFLTKLGWRDIVVVEQGPLFETGGSTSHAPGLVGNVNPSKTMAQFAMLSVQLYSSMELEGQSCWLPVGSLEVAWTEERLQELKRKVGVAKSWGTQAEVISTGEARDRLPLLSDQVRGAMYVPADGIARAVLAAEVLASEAKSNGASIHAHTRVTDIEVDNGRVRAVQTTGGRIETDTVLAAAGIWGPRLGRMAGVSIPLHPMQHLLAWTAPLPELKGETTEATHPILRNPDKNTYFRQRGEGYAIGSYQHEPMPIEPEEIVPHETSGSSPSIMPWTPSHFHGALQAAGELLAPLREVELVEKYNGMFSFTPDGMPILGESPAVKGFWCAEALWITHAVGAAQALAEWMIEGSPSVDVREMDIARFHTHAFSRPYLRAAASEDYRSVYAIIHPLDQVTHHRNLRLTAFHRMEEELGAVFFEEAGWERPQWYESNERLPLPDSPRRSGWEARHWSPIIAAEHMATREGVAMFDITPSTKLEVSGVGALDYLQHMAANQMDRPIGTITYTSMLNERGGIRCDLTVTRLERDRFLVITGASTGPADLAWMRGHLPDDGSTSLEDVSSSYCCIGVWGPRARELVREVSTESVSNDVFPYMAARRLMVGDVPALALRTSNLGELGWEFYANTEYGLRLWDTLWEAGGNLDVVAAGGGAFETLRLEKGFRVWGNDINTEYDPYEASLDHRVDLDKGEFLGRSALLRIREEGASRRLCCLVMDDPSKLVMGKEPILDGDLPIGYVTSSNFGYTVGKSIAYGYLPLENAQVGGKVKIEYFGQRYPATVAEEPLFDPDMTRPLC